MTFETEHLCLTDKAKQRLTEVRHWLADYDAGPDPDGVLSGFNIAEGLLDSGGEDCYGNWYNTIGCIAGALVAFDDPDWTQCETPRSCKAVLSRALELLGGMNARAVTTTATTTDDWWSGSAFEELFFPSFYFRVPSSIRGTPARAVAMLDRLIETGYVDWGVSYGRNYKGRIVSVTDNAT